VLVVLARSLKLDGTKKLEYNTNRKECIMSRDLNHIMPSYASRGLCKREDKNKVQHRWVPSGQSRALPGMHVGVECYCKHCGEREWGTVARQEFVLLSETWKELS